LRKRIAELKTLENEGKQIEESLAGCGKTDIF